MQGRVQAIDRLACGEGASGFSRVAEGKEGKGRDGMIDFHVLALIELS